jgi:hypothetical protein
MLLAGCASKPQRLAVGWGDYKNPPSGATLASDHSPEVLGAAVRSAASRTGLTPLLASDDTGLYTFSKDDKRFANTAWVLNVAVAPADGAGTRVRWRGFVFTSAPPDVAVKTGGQPFGGPRAFPSDGSLERDFRVALVAALGSSGSPAGSARLPADAPAVLAEFARRLPASWTVSFGPDVRTRTLAVSGIEPTGPSQWSLAATYGQSDAPQGAVQASLKLDQQGLLLRLVTQGQADIQAWIVDPDRISGQMVSAKGVARSVLFERKR